MVGFKFEPNSLDPYDPDDPNSLEPNSLDALKIMSWELNKQYLYQIHLSVWHTANGQWMIAIEFKIIRTEDYLKGKSRNILAKFFHSKTENWILDRLVSLKWFLKWLNLLFKKLKYLNIKPSTHLLNYLHKNNLLAIHTYNLSPGIGRHIKWIRHIFSSGTYPLCLLVGLKQRHLRLFFILF